MAVYKVPQDVEAEDKLIGPFSFRQFIYLIIAALGILMAYLLSRLFIGLIIIPLPLIALFLVLALPLRKDQPMETYLIALIRFFLKPRRRLWQPDGAMGLVQITVPKTIEQQLTKDFGGDEAAQRLSYLAQVIDTRGWSTRGVTSANAAMSDDIVAEAQNAEDILDDSADVSRSFDTMIEQKDTSYKQSVIQQFQQAIHQPTADAGSQPVTNSQPAPTSHQALTTDTSNPATALQADDSSLTASSTQLDYNPYPNSMHQRVISPAGQQPPSQQTDDTAHTATPPPTADAQKSSTPSEPPVSPDIMRLASNNDLSISAIAREAHRLESKDGEEVVISLR